MRIIGSGLAMAALLAVPHPRATARPHARATVILAGGCYWGIESVFRHVNGVTDATSGHATPDSVLSGPDGKDPVEAVKITYDPSVLSYRQILEVFFRVAHDPTQGDRQGPDVGPEYRSVVFVTSDSEAAYVRKYVDSLSSAGTWPGAVTTAIATLETFSRVPRDQQDYAAKHPDDPYIVTVDHPKIEALQKTFPALYHKR